MYLLRGAASSAGIAAGAVVGGQTGCFMVGGQASSGAISAQAARTFFLVFGVSDVFFL